MSTFSPARSQSSPDIASGALSASSSSSPAQLRSFNDIFMTPSSIQDSHRTRSSTLSNPSRTTSATPDPIRALQRTGSTQFFMFPGSPSPSTHPGTHGSPLHSRLERLWSSPYGTTSTGWSSATSFELLDMAEGGGFPHPPGMEHRRFGHERTGQSSLSLANAVSSLSDAVRILTQRVSILEQANTNQDAEISRLRLALFHQSSPSPTTPVPGTSTPPRKLQPLTQPYLYTPPPGANENPRQPPYASLFPPPLSPQHSLPTPSASPASNFSFPRPPRRPQTPPHLHLQRSVSWAQITQSTPPPGPIIPRTTSLSVISQSPPPGQSNAAANSAANSTSNAPHVPGSAPTSPQSTRRRSRGGNTELQAASRMRGVSFSSIAPVIAQAKWLSGQQPPATTGDPDNVTHPTLRVEEDADVDPTVFIRRILAFNDQQCSLYLQQRLKIDDDERRMDICRAVDKHVVELSLNKFGNFLVSRCFDHGGRALVDSYAAAFKGSILQLAMDQYGCHPLQKLQECGGVGTKEMIVEELIEHVETLTQKSAGHVWSKVLATPSPPSFYRRLSETGAGRWPTISRDETGSLIVQSVLETWIDADRSPIGIECGENLGLLATSQWGSFVVLHLVEHRGDQFRDKILADAVRLSLDHFGAMAVDKAFRREPNPHLDVVHSYLGAICTVHPERRPIAIDIALHATGAHLLSIFFTGPLATKKDQGILAQALLLHAPFLVESQFGQMVLGLVESAQQI